MHESCGTLFTRQKSSETSEVFPFSNVGNTHSVNHCTIDGTSSVSEVTLDPPTQGEGPPLDPPTQGEGKQTMRINFSPNFRSHAAKG